jgi:Fe2+ or Zn2+ uptake regulation protein
MGQGEAGGAGRGGRVTNDRAERDVESIVSEVGDMLRARGERMTGPRRAVLTALAEHGEHLSAETLASLVAEREPGVHRASVYRTLEALSDLGVVQHVHIGHGATAYHLVSSSGRHLHTHCRVCGSVSDLPSDLLDDVAATVSRRYGFRLDAGHVALSGVCRQCTRTRGHSPVVR